MSNDFIEGVNIDNRYIRIRIILNFKASDSKLHAINLNA